MFSQKSCFKQVSMPRILYGGLLALLLFSFSLFLQGCTGKEDIELAKENVMAFLPGVKADISVENGNIVLKNVQYTLGEAFGPTAGTYGFKELVLPGGNIKEIAKGDMRSLQKAQGKGYSIASPEVNGAIDSLDMEAPDGNLMNYLKAQTSSADLTDMVGRMKGIMVSRVQAKNYVFEVQGGIKGSLAEAEALDYTMDRGGASRFSGFSLSQGGSALFTLERVSLDSWNVPGMTDWMTKGMKQLEEMDEEFLLSFYNLPVSIKGFEMVNLKSDFFSMRSFRLNLDKGDGFCEAALNLDGLSVPPMILGFLVGDNLLAGHNQPLDISAAADFSLNTAPGAPAVFSIRNLGLSEKNLFSASVSQTNGSVDMDRGLLSLEKSRIILENKGIAAIASAALGTRMGMTGQELDERVRQSVDQSKLSMPTPEHALLFDNLYQLYRQKGVLTIDLTFPAGESKEPADAKGIGRLFLSPATRVESAFQPAAGQ